MLTPIRVRVVGMVGPKAHEFELRVDVEAIVTKLARNAMRSARGIGVDLAGSVLLIHLGPVADGPGPKAMAKPKPKAGAKAAPKRKPRKGA